MKRHIGAVHEGKRQQCSLCSYSGYEIRNIKQHILKKHPELVFKGEDKISSCQYCDYKTVGKDHFNQHILKHEELSNMQDLEEVSLKILRSWVNVRLGWV